MVLQLTDFTSEITDEELREFTSPAGEPRGRAPFSDGVELLLESTAGCTMELVLEQPEGESTDVLAPTPLRSVPGGNVEPPRPDATSVGSSEDADVAEVDSGLGLSTSTEEETPDAPPMFAAKEVTETPPPKLLVIPLRPVDAMLNSPHPRMVPRGLSYASGSAFGRSFDMVTAQEAALVLALG
ncbi:hypothetical protein Tco_1109934 [Tanacetum coccineum]|uniref:Uncharacterized protein n=1 Tax=Tanacetum coccineum TaxID=301880 RepID=A0ABQ5IHU1_9ASTR